MSEWIPVSERLPEDGERVLAFGVEPEVWSANPTSWGKEKANYWIAYYWDGWMDVPSDAIVAIWQPLPPMPESETVE